MILREGKLEWSKCESGEFCVWTLGSAFRKGKYCDAFVLASIALEIISQTSDDSLLKRLSKEISTWNGCWSMVATNGQNMVLATDRLRSRPIFFRSDIHNGICGPQFVDLIPSDEEWIPEKFSLEELLLSGYTSEDRTTHPAIKQVRPGQLLLIDEQGKKETKYYSFLAKPDLNTNEEAMRDELVSLLKNVFGRIVGAFSGREILVPLSGGIDSRLLVSMLKICGARNVTCLSYGVPGNPDSKVSQCVAESLGLNWIFVPYDSGDWKLCLNNPKFSSFIRFAGNGSSAPCLQDFLALVKLSSQLDLSGRVVMSGISGGAIAGVQIPAGFIDSDEKADVAAVVSQILQRRYISILPSRRTARRLRAKIKNQLESEAKLAGVSSASLLDYWEFENREPRYIINNVRAYDYLGLDWWNPLCDYELMDFFSRVPTCLRFRRHLLVAATRQILESEGLTALSEIEIVGEAKRVWADGASTSEHRPQPFIRRHLLPLVPDRWVMRRRIKNWREAGNRNLGVIEWLIGDTGLSPVAPLKEFVGHPGSPLFGLTVETQQALQGQLDTPIANLRSIALLSAIHVSQLADRPCT